MINFIKSHKFQIAVWLCVCLSISLNLYLIIGKYNAISFSDETIEEIELSEAEGFDHEEKQTEKVSFSNKIITSDVTKQDLLEKILAETGVTSEQAKKIASIYNDKQKINKLKPGSRVQIELARGIGSIFKSGETPYLPVKVMIFQDKNKYEATYVSSSSNYEIKKFDIPNEWKVKLVSGVINGSLFSAAKKQGADPKVVSQMINLFSYDVDFQRDIQAGDAFKILYEYQTDFRGKPIQTPRIISASLNLGGDQKDLYRYELPSGKTDYYDAKGNSIKRALLKTPISGAKVSSHFGMRMHPIHGFSKMHQGLDYSAPKGTPVLAAGDGVVQFTKRQGRGYGNHIQIKHNGTFSTMYAHLNRFASNIAPGSRVKQGQIIGYVGATGTATGAHLHYEVIQGGKKVNPARIKAPVFVPLKGTDLAKFKENSRRIEQMIAELDDENKINQFAKKTN